MKRDERLSLLDILERIKLVQSFTSDGKETFMNSRLIQEAVLRSLDVIGEAVRNLTDELRARYKNIAWAQIIAFRNTSIHAYWGMNMERVWQIIEHDLPPLQKQVETIIQDLQADED